MSARRYISSFKRDIENIVASMVSGKELEESVQELYKKYVRNVGQHGSNEKGRQPTSVTAMLEVSLDETSMLRGNPKVKEKVEQLLRHQTRPEAGIETHKSPKGQSNDQGSR
jgi:hypothetical protein